MRLLRRLLAAAATALLASGPFAPLLYVVPHLGSRAKLALAAARGRRRRPLAG